MSEGQSQAAAPGQEGDGEQGARQSGARTLAEWVSLGISLLLILSIAGYLVFQALRPEDDYLPAETRPLLEKVREQNGQYILPVEVANRGRRTLRNLKVEVTYRSREGKEESRELEIDYLGERSTQEAYLYFDRHPRELDVEVKPQSYRLD